MTFRDNLVVALIGITAWFVNVAIWSAAFFGNITAIFYISIQVLVTVFMLLQIKEFLAVN